MSVPNSLYDRPAIALQNLLEGRVGSAGTALIAPNSLSPSRLRTPAEVLMGEVTSEEQGSTGFRLKKFLAETFTNPLFLFGAIMSLRYPIAGGASLMKFRETVGGWGKSLGPIMRRISPLPLQFINTDIPKHMAGMADDVTAWGDKYSGAMLTAAEKYVQTTGRLPDALTSAKMASWLDGMHLSSNPLSRSPYKYKVGGKNVSRFTGAATNSKLVESLKADPAAWDAVQSTRKVLDQIRDVELSAASRQLIAQALNRKLWGKEVPDKLKSGLRQVSAWSKEFPSSAATVSARLNKSTGGLIGKTNDWGALAEQLSEYGIIRSQDVKYAQTQYKKIVSDMVTNGFYGEMKLYDNYFPHMTRMQQADMDEAIKKMARGEPAPMTGKELNDRSMVDAALGKEKVFGKQTTGSARNVTAPASRARHNLAMPDVREMALLDEAGFVNPGVMDHLKAVVGEGAPQYSLQIIPVMERYLYKMGIQDAWTSKRWGEKLQGDVKKLQEAGNTLGVQMMQDTYLPQALGRSTFRQSMQSIEWADTRNKWLTSMSEGTGLWKHVPLKQRQWFQKRLWDYHGPMSLGGFSGHLASYFYTSTLGLNPASALKNTLQTVTTTYPIIQNDLFRGMDIAKTKIGEYVTLRSGASKELGRRLTSEEAFRKAFPEFAKAGLEPSPMVQRLMKYADDSYQKSRLSTLGGGSVSSVGQAARTIRDKSLMMFQGTEVWNRLSTFYGGLVNARRGMGEKAALGAARSLVEFTQFPAGVGQTPLMMSNVPGVLRQFTHFPLRYASYLGGSTMLKWGEGPFAAKGDGRNWGPIGRALAASTAVYSAGKNLADTDLSQGLLWGALPLPMSPDMPFYPIPVVPPIVSLGGSAISAMNQQSWEPMRNSWPLLVPGGVALNRARRVFPPFADYSRKTPDGRVPIMSNSGSLVGYRTPLQLVGKAMGMGTLDTVRERDLMEYLVKQRDVIRSYRKDYLEALANNDQDTAITVQDSFVKSFPEFKRIPFRSQDLRAVKFRRRISRLERLLDTMPKEYRAEYGRVVAHTLGIEAQNLMGVDPLLLQSPGATARQRQRQPGY